MTRPRIPPLALVLIATALLASHACAQSRPAPRPNPMAQPPVTIADTVPPPPGVEHLAWLSSISGLPDSLERRAFMSAFRGAFAEGAYATERERDGHPAASAPLSARFRLIEGTGGWGAWDLRVALAWGARSGALAPGSPTAPVTPLLSVTVSALPPKPAGARAEPASVTVALESGGSGVERMRAAGRAAGLIAIERLHHLAGDLDPDTRLMLGPTRRIAP